MAEGRGVLGVPYLDGIQPRLTGRLACGPTEWSAYVGRLLVPDGRAGGDTDQFGLRLTHRWALPRGTLDLFANAAYFADHESYSPLLLRGAPRKMLALDLGLEWEHSLGQGWSWVTRVESYDQRSNLDLFGVRQTGVYLGLRWDGVR